MRPDTPENPYSDRPEPDRTAINYVWQRDVGDGACLTPAYSVESNPSILYTSAPHNTKNKMRNWHNGMYSRMDPWSARRLYEMEYGLPGPRDAEAATDDTAPTTSSERRTFNDDDVLTAFNSPQSRPVHGVPVDKVQATIATGKQVVNVYQTEEDRLYRANEETRLDLRRVRTELRNVRLCVDKILQDREMARREHRQARQNRRVLRQVSDHLRSLRYQVAMHGERWGQTMRQSERLRGQLEIAQAGLDMEVARAGLENVAAIKAEVGEEFLAQLVILGEESADLE